MKLDYSTLISPFPLVINQVGSIKSPTLKEIFNPEITYQGYNRFLSLLIMTPQLYYEKVNAAKLSWYTNLPDDKKLTINMFDIICKSLSLQSAYCDLLNFFFVENITWNDENNIFITYTQKDEINNIIPYGVINRNIFSDICSIILQRCGINCSNTVLDTTKVKSKRALEILNKIQQGKKKMSKKSNDDKDFELPNILTAVAVKSNSINFTNIWELTVYQLYEQFRREQTNIFFDIQKMSVAAYGNKDKQFLGTEWYKQEN